jgi:ABC-type transport system substrate-binding protein
MLLSSCTRKREVGNTLRVAVREKFRSLDPAHASDYYSGLEARRAYEGLLKYNYLKRPYVLEPHLAEVMPQVSKDKRTYTFQLRPGVYFQDDAAFGKDGKGREVTAEDFVYSFKRITDPAEASDGRWIFEGKVAEIKALDRFTLQITLVKPRPSFLHALTTPYASVVAREAVEKYGKEFGRHPVGTGPFRLETLTSGQVIWVRNPTYHVESYPTEGTPGDREAGLLADAGKPLPFVDKLVEDIIIEDQPAWLNFMQGNHDYLMKITKDNIADVLDGSHQTKEELRARGIRVHLEPGVIFNYFSFNMEDPIVGGEKNRFLRQAMSLAFDEVPAIEKFYFGLAKRAESPIPPGVGGYDPSYRNPSREYSLVKAREILKKSGHPNGEGIPELILDVRSDTTERQIAEYFQRSMAELGIKIKINQAAWPELISRIRRKQAQIWHISWVFDYPDAENGWQTLYGKNESPGSNGANYKNAEFDRLYDRIAAMPDGPARFALFKRMKEIFARDVPWVLTVHKMETRLSQPWLKNFKIHAFEGCVEKYLRVDAEARARAPQ